MATRINKGNTDLPKETSMKIIQLEMKQCWLMEMDMTFIS